MKIVEYGKENFDVIILLHGGGLSWWNYRGVAELLQDQFHVILPILDGHANSDKDFVSIEKNAEEIIAYIDEVHNGAVLLIGGVSLGGQILLEILSKRKDICTWAIIESALVIPMKLTHLLIKPSLAMSFGLIKKHWFAKLQFKSLHIQDTLFDEYYRDTCAISKENMIAFLKANSNYEIKKELSNTLAKVWIVIAEKEPSIMHRSAKKLSTMVENSVIERKKGFYHGEFSLNYPKEYSDMIVNRIRKNY